MGHISRSTAFERRSQWGAEMEVNFKSWKRCNKLHLMALCKLVKLGGWLAKTK